MSDDGATPRPWRFNLPSADGDYAIYGGHVRIATVSRRAPPEDAHNARLIVRAVNLADAVDALVRAARAIHDSAEARFHEDGRLASFITPNNMGPLLRDLRAALAAFDGGQRGD